MAKSEKSRVSNEAFEQAVFHWIAPQFIRYKRGVLWYLVMGLLDAALIAYAVWSDAITMVILFVILPLVFLYMQRHKPMDLDVKISPYGIQFGKDKIPFSSIRRFWIFHHPPYVDELHILTDNKWHPELTIPLMGIDPTLVRQYLITQIHEWEGKQPSLIDTLIRLLRLS
ncbi:hypothetical protein HOD30_02880 [Candidatus Peregrinibacteria bacterium]|jgi:hypothetical protein|nr:hypothetical protein [Candidatus Peregrinibacteria bacterium]MBT4631511.1 hypothetical protein [Candidatus Peregrinibacteria bacterium]MBT5516994.1 hypothetical protein [Candidatus Peregrinibacteria bacterium]MBT5823900.1 hypothetical protein [Candidatus Peregrinibacteria bacterium]